MKVGEFYGRHNHRGRGDCEGRLTVDSIVSPAVVTVECDKCSAVFGVAAERRDDDLPDTTYDF